MPRLFLSAPPMFFQKHLFEKTNKKSKMQNQRNNQKLLKSQNKQSKTFEIKKNVKTSKKAVLSGKSTDYFAYGTRKNTRTCSSLTATKTRSRRARYMCTCFATPRFVWCEWVCEERTICTLEEAQIIFILRKTPDWAFLLFILSLPELRAYDGRLLCLPIQSRNCVIYKQPPQQKIQQKLQNPQNHKKMKRDL